GRRGAEFLEVEGFSDELKDGDYDDIEDEEEEDEDESMFLPLDKMKKWQENKQRGFGESVRIMPKKYLLFMNIY
ncbi:hypothetical protein TorRG33x02_268480, partial [Trema orientale]